MISFHSSATSSLITLFRINAFSNILRRIPKIYCIITYCQYNTKLLFSHALVIKVKLYLTEVEITYVQFDKVYLPIKLYYINVLYIKYTIFLVFNTNITKLFATVVFCLLWKCTFIPKKLCLTCNGMDKKYRKKREVFASNLFLCDFWAIWHHFYNLKNVKTLMQECYF